MESTAVVVASPLCLALLVVMLPPVALTAVVANCVFPLLTRVVQEALNLLRF